MSFVLLAMIYSTAVGTLYILAVRIVKQDRFAFKVVINLLCIVGFAISLVGFTTLISKLYVIMGYLGIVLILFIMISAIFKSSGRKVT